MSLTDFKNPSPYWPWIKAIAKPLNIPGTSIGLGLLTDLQDELTDDPTQEKVQAMIEVIYLRTAEIAERLREEDGISVEEDALRSASQQLADELYLQQVAQKFFYADFKGIEQQAKFVSVPLDEIFVDLKASAEESAQTRSFEELELHNRLAHASEEERQAIALQLEEFDTRRSAADSDNNLGIDAILKDAGAIVLLGGPGSGKTTLVKRLARSCAQGTEKLRQLYPQMPCCFPVILPMTQFDTERAGRGLLDFAESRMLARGGESLLACYREHLLNGRVLFLCDGLDEIADTGGRIAAARAVDEAINGLGRNRLLLTSRRVGYALCRLTVPAGHYVLQPFTREDVATFSRQWHRAYERVIHPEHPDLAAAATEAESLIREIQGNASVELLATNPLMLTIIALIKHQNKILPDRRVELYELALKTLVASWNLARSLSDRPAGKAHGSYEQTRDLWAAVAYWMHETANREVSRDKLQARLEEVLVRDFEHPSFEAKGIAESYLVAAAETSGLLEARGPNTFAFVHQSFQEYLAEMHLARPAARAASRIKPLSHDPRWAEVIRLAAGHLGVTAGEKEALAEVIDALLNCPDPLEPILGVSLRLALGCLEDKVGIRAGQTDAILARAAAHLRDDPDLSERLPKLASAPGPVSEPLFVELVGHLDWRVRMESLRLLGRIGNPSNNARLAIQKAFADDPDPDVKGHAAWALWRNGWQQDVFVFTRIANAFTSEPAQFSTAATPELVEMAIFCLTDADSEVRWSAAEALGQWGQKESALPALVKLLEDTNSSVQLRAAQTLGQWGQKESALPALVKLLEDANSSVQLRAAQTLGQWGQKESALPALVKLLEDANSGLRWNAAQTLGQWGQKESALPALVKLLEDANSSVRLSAAQTLGQWGQKESALPALVKLLEHANSGLRWNAAQTLGQWGQKESALSALVKLLEHADSDVRLIAAQTLRQWSPQESALPALVKLLEHADSDVRLRAVQTLRGWLKKKPAWVYDLLLSAGFKAAPELREVFLEENGKPTADLAKRKTIAGFLASLPSDSPKAKSIREIVISAIRQVFTASA